MKYFGIGNSHNEKGELEVFVGYDETTLELQRLKVVNTTGKSVKIEIAGENTEVFGSSEFASPVIATLEKKNVTLSDTTKKDVVDFPEGLIVSITY